MPESAWHEYKILQDKVDRIADFRFRIKGWMVTIVLAISFGGYATGRLPPIAYGGLAFVVLVFYLFEQSQAAWHNAFIDRLLNLEKEIAFLEARKAMAKPELASFPRKMGPRLGPAISREKRRIRTIRLIGPIWHFVISYSHGIFYLSTLIIVAFMWWLSYSYPRSPMPETRVDRSADAQIGGSSRQQLPRTTSTEQSRELPSAEEAEQVLDLGDGATTPNDTTEHETSADTNDRG